MITLVISPHLDDAVLSLAGTLQVFRGAGQRVLVLTAPRRTYVIARTPRAG